MVGKICKDCGSWGGSIEYTLPIRPPPDHEMGVGVEEPDLGKPHSLAGLASKSLGMFERWTASILAQGAIYA